MVLAWNRLPSFISIIKVQLSALVGDGTLSMQIIFSKTDNKTGLKRQQKDLKQNGLMVKVWIKCKIVFI